MGQPWLRRDVGLVASGERLLIEVMMRNMRTGLLSLSMITLTSCAGISSAQSDATPPADPSTTTLWYDKPAAKWEEALPVGSGRLGAMVFGGITNERVQFNEDTLWTGKPQDYTRDGAGDHLAEIQKLIFDGKQEEAADLFRAKMISKPVRQKAYQPFGRSKG